MRGIVYKSTGSWYQVKTDPGDFLQARIKGKFKIDEITSSNPVAVGDLVELEPEPDQPSTAVITEIHTRKNYITRRSPAHPRQHNIVAANLDQSLLIATLKEPRTSQGFIDRFLVASEAYQVPAILLFNKADLYGGREIEKFEAWKAMYNKIGYTVLLISIKNNTGMEELRGILESRVTLLSGHSGVGKSTLINALIPDRMLKTKEVSGWSGKGMHTTTFAEMFDLPFGGKIIDTPGMREFGLVDISKQELSHYFPEMRNLLQDCQFNNCLHLNEPGCAVKAAVDGKIHADRYISYLTILDSIGEEIY